MEGARYEIVEVASYLNFQQVFLPSQFGRKEIKRDTGTRVRGKYGHQSATTDC